MGARRDTVRPPHVSGQRSETFPLSGGRQVVQGWPSRTTEGWSVKALCGAIMHLIEMHSVLASVLGELSSNYVQTSISRFEKGSVHN